MRALRRIAAAGLFVVTLGLLCAPGNAAASSQCAGRVAGLGASPNDEVAVVLQPDWDCGCQGNRLVQSPTAANHKTTYTSALAALMGGKRVSLTYDWDPATPCHNCGSCLFYDLSIFP